MESILITGCNRGLGLQFVKQLAKHQSPPKNIIATCRSIEKAKELQSLVEKNKNIHIIELDVANFKAFDEVSEEVGRIVGDNGLNVLINNAGVTTKFTRLNMVKAEQMMDNFTVNTLAPLMLTKALVRHLKAAALKNSMLPMGTSRAAIINISSILGSIEKNTDGGFYPYRTSKAGLNAVTRSLGMDLKNDGILSVALHPGWVQTDMGGKQAPLQVEQSISSILATMSKLGAQHNGTFIQYDGTSLPW